MFDNRDELERKLWKWLGKGSKELADTRNFLGSGSAGARRGLGDSQIANWRHRHDEPRLPETFVEGAALHHCARKDLLDPVEYTKIKADRFWHIFFVRGGDEDDGQRELNCGIFRYWENVRSLGRAKHLTYTALRSIDKAAAMNTTSVEADQKPGKGGPEPKPLGRQDAGFDHKYDPDGSLFTSWNIDTEPHDYGYTVDFPKAIVNKRDEAVGSTPTIPVGVAHQLVFLPEPTIIRLRNMRLSANPKGLPSAFSLLPGGNPVLLMESYLGIRDHGVKGDARRLGHWFEQGPHVEEGIGPSPPPKAIRENPLYEGAVEAVQQGRCMAFSTRVEAPPPFLFYFMVF